MFWGARGRARAAPVSTLEGRRCSQPPRWVEQRVWPGGGWHRADRAARSLCAYPFVSLSVQSTLNSHLPTVQGDDQIMTVKAADGQAVQVAIGDATDLSVCAPPSALGCSLLFCAVALNASNADRPLLPRTTARTPTRTRRPVGGRQRPIVPRGHRNCQRGLLGHRADRHLAWQQLW